MAINFETTDPSRLLEAFKKAIRDGNVVTWAVDKDGDFYHTPDQWTRRGWLRPTAYTGRLTLNFIPSTAFKTRWADLGVIQGRFIESMIMHCNQLFDTASATARPTNSDQINTTATA
ncbi:hypothetical protein [Bradyrhizobium sp. BWA-3-5]|uniref:hypothetical protein n=1 Tax=Bradyrhizobium sp. BWA-3-5 TaxID=3080013 RepID=UPI00293F2E39|nr:hypothetical protein [Bradyrhizobium sp. BWA-3-5]WOH64129.1 hypothetical protein RX331_26505 [Bradyrhizobium sp. BWA-3-5]WOH64246.1 hypothetical protein RX331_27245 [Bradyrhizobium sp. BWA-3-5]WOH70174.1 hypothetical protein RX331_38425 [Bradyrhizobium sp. BWA-3-5]